MKICNFLFILLIIFGLIYCSEKQEKVSLIKENNLEMQMIEAYNEGFEEFNSGDIFFAAKKFNEVENFFAKNKPDIVFMAVAKVGGIMANIKYPVDFFLKNSIKGFKKILFRGL